MDDAEGNAFNVVVDLSTGETRVVEMTEEERVAHDTQEAGFPLVVHKEQLVAALKELSDSSINTLLTQVNTWLRNNMPDQYEEWLLIHHIQHTAGPLRFAAVGLNWSQDFYNNLFRLAEEK